MKTLCTLLVAIALVAGCGKPGADNETMLEGDEASRNLVANTEIQDNEVIITGRVAQLSLGVYPFLFYPVAEGQVVRLVDATVNGIAKDVVYVAVCAVVQCKPLGLQAVLPPDVLRMGNLIKVVGRGLRNPRYPLVKYVGKSFEFLGVNPPSNLKLAVSFPGAPYFPTYHVRVSWRDGSFNETKFKLERQVEQEDFVTIALLPPNSTEFIDRMTGRDASLPPLPASPRYTYRLSAVGDAGSSPQITATTLIPVLPQAAVPSDLVLKAVGNSIQATWKDNSDNETSFSLVYFDNNDLSGREYTIPLGKNTTRYTIYNLKPGKDYYVKIYAIIAGGLSLVPVIDHIVLPVR